MSRPARTTAGRQPRPADLPQDARAKAAYERTAAAWPQGMLWPLAKIHRYGNNPRRNEQAVADVATSLRDFGARQPIVVDRAGIIVVGDTRFLAALQLGWPAYPVHVADNLTEAEARAYRLADNKTGERSEWDFPRLNVEFRALEELGLPMTLSGFRDYEIAPIMAADYVPPPAEGSLEDTKRTDGGSNRGAFTFSADQQITVLRAVDRFRREIGPPTLAVAEAVAQICRRYAEPGDPELGDPEPSPTPPPRKRPRRSSAPA